MNSASHSRDVEIGPDGPSTADEDDDEGKTLLHGKGPNAMRQAVAQAPREACFSFFRSWLSRKFATGCAILFPVVVTFLVTFWFLNFFDGIFSPIYKKFFKIEIFGLGFITSMAFIIMTGVFFSSWVGSGALALGEWIIRRLPLIKHIYSASKQVTSALNPDNESSKAFQECVIIRHPRNGSYAFGFITGQTSLQTPAGDVKLNSIYVATNHLYVGDLYLLEDKDVIRTNLSVREGLECVVSVGMAIPPTLRQVGYR